MSVAKETAVQQIRSAKIIEFVLGIVGGFIGYAISYWFQPELLRAKCSLGQYFSHIGDIVTNKDTAPTAIIVTLVVGIVFELLGKYMVSRAKLAATTVLSDVEIRQASGEGRIIIGKIKEGEDTPAGSIKRIVKMMMIGLGVIFLILILLVVLMVVFSGNVAR
jgi:RsiW-degrading membrane proteinase PrsW (M82 family)